MIWHRGQMLVQLLVGTLLGNVTRLATLVTLALKTTRTTTRAGLHQDICEGVGNGMRVLGMFGQRSRSTFFQVFVRVFGQHTEVPVRQMPTIKVAGGLDIVHMNHSLKFLGQQVMKGV